MLVSYQRISKMYKVSFSSIAQTVGFSFIVHNLISSKSGEMFDH